MSLRTVVGDSTDAVRQLIKAQRKARKLFDSLCLHCKGILIATQSENQESLNHNIERDGLTRTTSQDAYERTTRGMCPECKEKYMRAMQQ